MRWKVNFLEYAVRNVALAVHNLLYVGQNCQLDHFKCHLIT